MDQATTGVRFADLTERRNDHPISEIPGWRNLFLLDNQFAERTVTENVRETLINNDHSRLEQNGDSRLDLWNFPNFDTRWNASPAQERDSLRQGEISSSLESRQPSQHWIQPGVSFS